MCDVRALTLQIEGLRPFFSRHVYIAPESKLSALYMHAC